ncbi:unnamed protein product [Cyclocybe aegerita]|uniref:Uncharacterized protein n=1 Tax=Cyclocybe aegerita TaxID=1973307 RepID=A0A8S0W1G3_CYCAE|nr:unnamed protein product [Cyclocybe aegerita]
MSRVTAGLPTNPRQRVARPFPPPQAAPRQQDEQRPMRSISTPRPRHVSTHSEGVPVTRTRTQSRPRNDYQATRDARLSRESNSTSASSSSASSERSFWARSSQRSSRTTLPSDDKLEYNNGGQEGYKPSGSQEESSFYSFRDIDTGVVWSRVTGAASTLTQEVSKAWASGLGPLNHEDDDEEDSHLTRVMRAYHLSKARTPAELPDWLFSERERGQGGLLRPDAPNDGSHVKPVPSTERRHPRDMQSFPRPTHSDAQSKSIRSRAGHSEEMTAARPRPTGMDRLKSIRDLKRNASNIRPMVKV